MERSIVVLAAKSQEDLEMFGADVEETHWKYHLTEEAMKATESTVRLGYAQVLQNGKCVRDFFGK